MPAFFGLTFDELLAAKHPTAWVEFERGDIDQQRLFDKFFKDGRPFDGEGLVRHMVRPGVVCARAPFGDPPAATSVG